MNFKILEGHGVQKSFYRKASVGTEDGKIFCLYSYDTLVAWYDYPKRKFHRAWDGWSATTSRHIKAFMIMLGIDYAYPCKKAWEKMTVEVPT